jgi:predicted Fe-S protein YdhL (DUF1289 family)
MAVPAHFVGRTGMNLARWCVACSLANLASIGACAQECKIEIRPPILDPVARDGHRDREIYGWQLMTLQERNAFLAQLDAGHSPEERQAVRLRQHKAMDARARERGVALTAPSKADGDPRPHPGPARDNVTACVTPAK